MKWLVLYPFSTLEIQNYFGSVLLYKHLEKILIYGFYPQVFNKPYQEIKDNLNQENWVEVKYDKIIKN